MEAASLPVGSNAILVASVTMSCARGFTLGLEPSAPAAAAGV